jgi:methylmalonyl-CoA mutase N-terminal domain/subunit
VESKAWELINRIDAMGGAVSAIEQGFVQDEIARSAYQYQRDVESGQKVIVGVNKFVVPEEVAPELFRIDDSIRQVQTEKLQSLKSRRDNEKVSTLLQQLENAAHTTENLMPIVVEAVENYCTLGEIADTLRKVWGEHR